jgi:DsbC/DsbD-like thiol-disulfide interchange protein
MKFLFLIIFFPVFSAKSQSKFDRQIADATKHIFCSQPDERNPVTINAQSVKDRDSIAVIVKVLMAPGWHIYAYVPSTQPYIASDPIMRLPENFKAVGGWKTTEPFASSDDPGVLIYEHEVVFVHKAVKLPIAKTDASIRAGLYYQTCNLRQCLPPTETTLELKY